MLPAALVVAAGLAIGDRRFHRRRCPSYSIQAIRFADSPQDKVAEMVIGAPPEERVDTVYAVWLIRGGGRSHSLRLGVSPRPLVQGVDRE